MTALTGLLKKEFRLIRSGMIVVSTIWFVYFIGLFVAALRYSPHSVYFFSMLPLGIGVWFVPAYLMTSLGEERKKLHLWLHNPQPAWVLIGTKLAAALGASVVTTVVSIAGMYAFLSFFGFGDELHILQDWRFYSFLGIGTPAVSSYLATWFLFGWVFNHSIHRYFGKLSLMITFAVIIGAIALLFNVGTSEWFVQLVNGIDVSITLPIGMEGSVDGSSGNMEFRMTSEGVSVLHLLFHIGVMLLLFVISCRLIDRAVEV